MRVRQMKKVHHFVVHFDEVRGVWDWDWNIEEARFEEGTIYDYDTGEWSSGYLGDGEYEPAEDELIEQLKQGLALMNKANGKTEGD